MGQEITSIQEYPSSEEDVLSKQISLYQWRADPNCNSFIPRTSFKNASTQQQQDLFAQFLSQQNQKQYLELYKFKQQLSKVNVHHHEQIVVFQQYHSTLQAFQNKLSFEESVYVLHGLLSGYQQLKKMFQKVVVNSSCCFVTAEGTIRAWVNPNHKSNQLWLGQFHELVSEFSSHHIIAKIVDMARNSCRSSQKSHLFFSELNKTLARKSFIDCNFSQIRKWINQYCFLHRINMVQRINLSPDENKTKENQQHYKKSIRTQAKQIRSSLKQKSNVLKSNVPSKTTDKFTQTANLVKSKSIDQKMYLAHENQFFNNAVHINYANSKPPICQVMDSQAGQDILKKTHRKSYKYSFALQTSQTFNRKLGNTINSGMSQRQNEMCQSECFQIKDIKLNELQQAIRVSSPLVSNRMAEQEVKVELPRRESKKSPILKKKPEKNRNTMQVSLMNAIKQNQREIAHEKRAEDRYRTAYLSKEQIQSSNNSQSIQRPWITTKTITRLISDHSNMSSLKKSITESSEYYNCSEYSGALTQMGRDITYKPVQQGRTKTLRVSRNFQL